MGTASFRRRKAGSEAFCIYPGDFFCGLFGGVLVGAFIGLLNGFLPCGLVYVALAGAITTGGWVMGGLYMVTFGLGTLPVMLAVSLAGRLLGTGFRTKLTRLVPIAGTVLAMLFILRGLSLGIPFVSPTPAKTDTGQATMDCCHKAVDSTAIQITDSVGR